MVKLEDKIIKKIYRFEAKKTTGYLLLKFFLGALFLFLTYIFSSITIEILNEQQSFDLLDFFRDDFEVIRRYFFENLFDFYQELPQPLFLLLMISILLLLVIVFVLVKNFKTIKNKLVSIYKFYKTK